jgi:spore coat protein H
MKRYLAIIAFLLPALCGCSGGSHGGSDIPVVEPPPDYALAYNRTTLDEYELELTTANWQALQNAPFEYVPGTLRYKDEVYSNIGIRYKGNSSYFSVPPPKKSFKLHLNEFVADQLFHGLKKLNFNNCFKDPSLMREMVGYDIFEATGCPASRTSHIKLYVTVPGIYSHEFFGVYISVEQVNKDFLADRYPESEGNLYKAGQQGADLHFLGYDKSAYTTPTDNPPYEKKTNEIEDDWSDFIHFLDVLNNTSPAGFKTEIEKVFNVDGFLSYLAANTVLSNMDSVAGRQCNFYLYHNMITDRFEFIAWDLNEVFGNFHGPGQDANTMLTLDIYDPTSLGPHVLVDKILGVPEYVSVYEERIRTLIDGAFSVSAMHPEIDAIYDRIKADVYLDTHKQYSSANFDKSIYQDIPNATDVNRILGLKPFVTDRVYNVDQQLP